MITSTHRHFSSSRVLYWHLLFACKINEQNFKGVQVPCHWKILRAHATGNQWTRSTIRIFKVTTREYFPREYTRIPWAITSIGRYQFVLRRDFLKSNSFYLRHKLYLYRWNISLLNRTNIRKTMLNVVKIISRQIGIFVICTI